MPPRSRTPIPGITHGLGPTGKPSGYAQGCGCDVCREAKNAYERDLRAARPRTPRPQGSQVRHGARSMSTSYTGREAALITQLAAGDGVRPGTWVRYPVLAILAARAGYEDTAPRYEPPGPRDAAPPAAADDRRTARIRAGYTLDEIALIRRLAAEDGIPVTQWLRNPVLAILEERAGYRDTERRRTPRSPNRKPRAKVTKPAAQGEEQSRG